MNDLTMRFILHGDVQMVGLRQSLLVMANESGIKGSVKNLGNGTVELILRATESEMSFLLSRLKKEFEITDIEEKSRPGLEEIEFSGFSIMY